MTQAKAKSDSPKNQIPASYEAASGELDQLLKSMEAGQMPLDQLLVCYERGAYLLNFCKDKLQALETQVKVIDDGQLKSWAAA